MKRDIWGAGHHNRRNLDWETDKEREGSEEASEEPENISQSGRHMKGNPETSAATREIQRVGQELSEWETHREAETGQERHPESRTKVAQLGDPTAMTVSNSRLGDTIGRPHLGGSLETIGKQLWRVDPTLFFPSPPRLKGDGKWQEVSRGCVSRLKSKKVLWLVDPTLFPPSPTPIPKVEG